MRVRWVGYFRARNNHNDVYVINTRYGEGFSYTAKRIGHPLYFDTKEDALSAAEAARRSLWSAGAFESFAKANKVRRRRARTT